MEVRARSLPSWTHSSASGNTEKTQKKKERAPPHHIFHLLLLLLGSRIGPLPSPLAPPSPPTSQVALPVPLSLAALGLRIAARLAVLALQSCTA